MVRGPSLIAGTSLEPSTPLRVERQSHGSKSTGLGNRERHQALLTQPSSYSASHGEGSTVIENLATELVE